MFLANKEGRERDELYREIFLLQALFILQHKEKENEILWEVLLPENVKREVKFRKN